MYINAGYLNNSRTDFKDNSTPLVVGSCGTGYLILLGVAPGDDETIAERLWRKDAVGSGQLRHLPAENAP